MNVSNNREQYATALPSFTTPLFPYPARSPIGYIQGLEGQWGNEKKKKLRYGVFLSVFLNVL